MCQKGGVPVCVRVYMPACVYVCTRERGHDLCVCVCVHVRVWGRILVICECLYVCTFVHVHGVRYV